ncbi:MAG TPA: hypothetical protein DCZ94_00510 [Lentisphaeria bacterium]|nr:MAG: hypothetical protein A2X48_12070 [Lentisphaerae bacterium GWF2_49_21]HBC85413.1 hypothetical protein [Lentisphaeria bacterium]
MRVIISGILMMLFLSIAPLKGAVEEPSGQDAAALMQQGKTKEAIAIFEKLAAKGDSKAMVEVGLCYYEGRGVKQDYPAAMDWFLKAFSSQNADAFVNLGVMHRDGQGVPENKKIAYCVFLTTHMCGLGSESTQARSNSCLRRLVEKLTKEEIKDCLSNYTVPYVMAYMEAKGKLEGIPDKYKPSKESPAIKDLDWWMDGELDGLYGPPTEEEKKLRKEKAEMREKEFNDLVHTLVFQVKFPGATAEQYKSYNIITDGSMGSSAIRANKLTKGENETVYEDSTSIFANQHRYITLESKEGKNFVYEIKHPVKPSPTDWSKWQKPVYTLKTSMETFSLMSGRDPKSKINDIPVDSPEIRFKVVKE